MSDYLYCPCPAAQCTNKKVTYWYHNACGGKTKLRYSDVYIYCDKCYSSGIMFDWRFSCAEHGFKSCSKQGCLYALAIMGQLKGNQDLIVQASMKLMTLWPK